MKVNVFVTLLRLNSRTDIDEFWQRDRWDPQNSFKLLQEEEIGSGGRVAQGAKTSILMG